MAPHSSTLAWKIPSTEEPGRLQSMASLRVGHDWTTSLSLFAFIDWRRKWQPTPVFLHWRIPGTGEPSGLPSMGSHRVGHDWSDLYIESCQRRVRKYSRWPLGGSRVKWKRQLSQLGFSKISSSPSLEISFYICKMPTAVAPKVWGLTSSFSITCERVRNVNIQPSLLPQTSITLGCHRISRWLWCSLNFESHCFNL